MTIQENISLRNLCTFRVGGPARYFSVVHTAEELRDVLLWIKDKEVPYFILGGGSNVLFPDTGFAGLVIKPEFHELAIQDTQVSVGASVTLEKLIQETLVHGLVGMEFAAGIPGSVGGAVRGNAGTYGVGMSDVLTSARVVHERDFSIRDLTNAECGFSYRHSIFKKHTHIITMVAITLKKGDVTASKKIIDDRITIRHQNHPLEPSAGCIFKNVEFAKVNIAALESKGLSVEKFRVYQKIPAGYLIDELGLKGRTIGGAQISSRHANYIINTGSARFEDVIMLISLIKQQVRDRYGIQLEEEVQVVG